MPKPSSTTITTDATTDTLGSASLLDQIMAETKLVPAQEGYQVVEYLPQPINPKNLLPTFEPGIRL